MHTPSWIELDEMVNVRDVGGLPTRNGHRTRSGVLLRGEHPDDLGGSGVKHLVEVLGLKLVVDLRMAPEREGRGSPLLDAGVEILAFPMWEDPRTTDAMVTTLSEDEGARVMGEFYVHVLDHFQERAGQVLERIVHGGVPTYVHCAAGKDRTGMVVAMLLGAADVEPESIVADYAATEIRLKELLARLSRTLDPKDAATASTYPKYTTRAHPDSMRYVLNTLTDRHGTLREWWRAGGVDDAMLDEWYHLIVE